MSSPEGSTSSSAEALIGQLKPARMPQHVGMKRTESGTPGSGTDEVVDRLPGHRLPAFRYNQPRQGVVACMQVALDRSQFIAGDRMLDGQTILESPQKAMILSLHIWHQL